MEPITFDIEIDEDGALCARWDDPKGAGGISTFGYSLAELDAMVDEAFHLYFDGDARKPSRYYFHFLQNPYKEAV